MLQLAVATPPNTAKSANVASTYKSDRFSTLDLQLCSSHSSYIGTGYLGFIHQILGITSSHDLSMFKSTVYLMVLAVRFAGSVNAAPVDGRSPVVHVSYSSRIQIHLSTS
jgi:hypothetical protein